MNESATIEGASPESEKPVISDTNVVKFPPFPDPSDQDFDDDISEEERNFYKTKFSDLNHIKSMKLHCSACDKHIGCSTRNETRMRAHPMLRTLVCDTCHTFYNSGEFEKGDDGSELYCRWCGQGGQVYCCSDCPHVFCAKCIRRNFGTSKIREIEYADDWKCFKCNSNCLWDLRATCWALLRYCDLRNKIIHQTQDPDSKDAYMKDCVVDTSECCKNKGRRKEKSEGGGRKRDSEGFARKVAANIISKIPPTIQVKKFASIPLDDSPSIEKKSRKRSASPKSKPVVMKNPIPIAGGPKISSPIIVPSLAKKMRMPIQPIAPNLLKYNDNRPATYTRIRPKLPHMPQMPQMPIPIISNHFNGFNSPTLYNTLNNMVNSDNINLSLESLTQGLDMSAMASITNNARDDDDVVCTPDFPMEPLCEVTEDNDDDVQCITPAPAPKLQTNPPPLVSRTGATLPDLTTDNIVQMTDNDVTVNSQTGGLKFRVDPQTLSSNKMYRLPDGRIFAINANPNMPGGYSATIVAVTESAGKLVPKGATYAAKLSAVTTANTSTSTITKTNKNSSVKPIRVLNPKRSVQKRTHVTSGTETPRECNLKVPVEWYRYNLIDAVDALEYSLSRLNKLKKETTSMFLRTRTVGEMRTLHKTLDRLLNTSSTRFNEIKENLNKGLKQYLAKKMGDDMSEDDDDVEILPNMEENDDPIFIDENSIDSNENDNQEVDLTGAGSSEHNDSRENRNDSFSRVGVDPLNITDQDVANINANNDLHNSHFHSLVNDVSDTNDDDDKQHNFEEKSNNEGQDIKDESKPDREEKSQNNEVNKVNDSLNSSNSLDDINGVEENDDEGDDVKQEGNENCNMSKEDTEDKIKDEQKMQRIEENNENKEDNEECSEKAANNAVNTENIKDTENIQDSDDSNEKTAQNEKRNEETAQNEKSNEKTAQNEKSNEKTVQNEKSNEKTDRNEKSIENINDSDKDKGNENNEESNDIGIENNILNDKVDIQDADEKIQDSEMSEEMIETLLQDDVDASKLSDTEISEVSGNLT